MCLIGPLFPFIWPTENIYFVAEKIICNSYCYLFNFALTFFHRKKIRKDTMLPFVCFSLSFCCILLFVTFVYQNHKILLTLAWRLKTTLKKVDLATGSVLNLIYTFPSVFEDFDNLMRKFLWTVYHLLLKEMPLN